jgi:putative colanic acid biosynthesis acetyltransferase WcaF
MDKPREHKSEWTTKEKLARAGWMVVQASLFRLSFHNMYGWRNLLLRLFGASIEPGVRVRPTARIEIPWNVKLDRGVVIGDFATLYSLGLIEIGANTVVSQHAYLCAGSHDYTKRTFDLLKPPIKLGTEVWVAADVFVGPGVSIGDRAVIGARSTVLKDVPNDVVAVGYPARVVGPRPLSD